MELLFWLTIIGYIQDATMLAAFIIFLMTPKAGRKNFLVIGVILAFGFIVEAAAWIGWSVFHINPNLINLVYSYFIVPAFFFFYKPKISSQKTNSLFLVLVVIYLLFALCNSLFYQTPQILPSYTMAMQSLVLIIFSITFFFRLCNDLPRAVYIELPVFWINCAVIIYFFVLFFIYIITDYIYITLKLSIIPLWIVHNSVGTVYYAFLAVGLWRNRSLYIPQSALKG